MIDFNIAQLSQQITHQNNTVSIHTPPSWDYFFNGMQEILPGVYLGPYSVAQQHCLNYLKEKGIKYIICVRQHSEAHFIKPQLNDPNLIYLTLEINDNETENILRFFPKVNSFIDEALAKNYRVLVHGNSGNSRSASLVLAYVMQKLHLSFCDALRFVKSKRESIHPNEGFKAQLFEYEPIYKARLNFRNGGSSSSTNIQRSKRKLDEFGVENDENEDDFNLIPPPPSPNILDDDSDASSIIETINNNNNNTNSKNIDFSSQVFRVWSNKR